MKIQNNNQLMTSLSWSACIRLASLALCGSLLYKAVSSRRARIPARAAFLGIDVSTQSCKLLVTDARRHVLHSIAVNFERDLPHYRTTDGFIKQGREVCAPSLMFVEALELALSQLHSRGFDFQTVVAVSASGQQHGSIWWRWGADIALDGLNLHPQHPMTATLKDSFSLPLAPIWMDSSTQVECSEMEHFVHGPERMASISGSRAYERFTGPQIRRRIKSQPEVYDNTERISLISSFVPTLLLGRYAPIDQADGSGMNLMDLRTGTWSPELLEACTHNTSHANPAVLRSKLGEPVPSHQCLGTISAYMQQRYGFSSSCIVIAATGDNPSAFACLPPGAVGVSLGTSDTVLAPVQPHSRNGLDGHLFRNPIDSSTHMALLCFKNGSLARQRVRDLVLPWSQAVASTSRVDLQRSTHQPTWDMFDAALQQRPAAELGVYYFEPEITPHVAQACVAHSTSNQTQSEIVPAERVMNVMGAWSAEHECCAVVESQAMAMRLFAQRLGLASSNRIVASGGASHSKAILQTIADVFGCDVYRDSASIESAALGAVLRAIHGWVCVQRDEFVSFSDAQDWLDNRACLQRVCSAQPTVTEVYSSRMPAFESLVQAVTRFGK